MTDIYSDDVHYKFTPDCQFMEFHGATIVSPIASHEVIYQELAKISQEAQQMSYCNKRVFMPEPSYHMTNFVLYNDHQKDRNSSGWSTKMPNDTPMDEMNRFIYEAIKDIKKPQSYRMRLVEVLPSKLEVAPADEATTQDLLQFRAEVADATGICCDDHERYAFHITYAYALIKLTDEEDAMQKELLSRQTARLKEVIPEFDIAGGVYCTFRDMSHFEPYVP